VSARGYRRRRREEWNVRKILLQLSSSSGLLLFLESFVSRFGVLVLLGEDGDGEDRRAGPEVLHAQYLEKAEADEEDDKDTEVPPKILDMVLVSGEDVVCSSNEGLARDGACEIARRIRSDGIRVGGEDSSVSGLKSRQEEEKVSSKKG